jgi:hypothetical protein
VTRSSITFGLKNKAERVNRGSVYGLTERMKTRSSAFCTRSRPSLGTIQQSFPPLLCAYIPVPQPSEQRGDFLIPARLNQGAKWSWCYSRRSGWRRHDQRRCFDEPDAQSVQTVNRFRQGQRGNIRECPDSLMCVCVLERMSVRQVLEDRWYCIPRLYHI